MANQRVVHYLNQFFAGIGGEDRAAQPPDLRIGPIGPGVALQALLTPDAELVATVYCGDNYLAEWAEVAVDRVVELIAAQSPSVVVAGPAFGSGRYGLACGQVARAVREKLGLPVVSGMHESNPGVEMHRARVYIVPTRDSGIGMGEALAAMASLTRKLARGDELGPADEEGYFPTGRRVNQLVAERGARRATAMLLRRLRGESFKTEWELPRYEPVIPAPPVQDLHAATIALVSESGCVPHGNPDSIKSSWATTWAEYPIGSLDDFRRGEYEFIHGGYDTTFVDDDPDRMVPLDAVRELEREGVFGRLHPSFLSICGSMAPLSVATRFGKEVAAKLREADVQACILTAT